MIKDLGKTMRKSILFYAINRMMKQDKWAERYNSDNRFDVNQYDYDTLNDYLEALRSQWKDYADPFGDYENYVDVSDYDDFDSYEEDVEMYMERKSWRQEDDSCDEFGVNPCDFDNEEDYLENLRRSWKREYDPADEFGGIDPADYDSASDYQDAINERIDWKQTYDYDEEFDVDPCDYEWREDYLEALRESWKNKYDPADEFGGIDPANYDSVSAYQDAINERIDWKQTYDYDEEFDVDPCYYEWKEDYLEALRESWKIEYDPADEFGGIDPADYDNVNEYRNEIEEKESWKEKYDSDNEFEVDPCDYDNEEEYLEALRNSWKDTYDSEGEYEGIDPADYISASDYYEEIENRVNWRETYDYDEDFDVNPCEYDNEEEYLEALQNSWKDTYDADDEFFDVNQHDFEELYDYIDALRDRWKEVYDEDDEYCDVDPGDFDFLSDYLEALEEKKSEEEDRED